jgi:hypothetical protein
LAIAFAIVMFVLLAFAPGANASPGALKFLVLESASGASNHANALRTDLLAQPGVAEVGFFDTYVIAPTLADLTSYDAVIVTSNVDMSDPVATGDAVADFQDEGGAVIVTAFSFEGAPPSAGWALGGRFMTDQYSPYANGATAAYVNFTLGVFDATSPLLSGVSTLNGHFQNNVTLNPGATELAKWSTGKSGVAVKDHALAINEYLGDDFPPNKWSGDWARMIVNAADLLGRQTVSVTRTGPGTGAIVSSTGGIDCGVVCSSTPLSSGTETTFTATATDKYSSFVGWSGSCTGTTTCTFMVARGAAAVAQFASDKMTIGKPKLNKKKGTATLSVTVLGPGKFVLSGQTVAKVSKTAAKAGTVKLTVEAKGKLKKKLAGGGSGKAALQVVFTPTGGKAGTSKTKLKLVKK